MNDSEVDKILKEINENKNKKQKELFNKYEENQNNKTKPLSIDVPLDEKPPVKKEIKSEPIFDELKQIEKNQADAKTEKKEPSPQQTMEQDSPLTLSEEPQNPDFTEDNGEQETSLKMSESDDADETSDKTSADENTSDGVYFAEYDEEEMPQEDSKKKRNKIIIAAVCIVVAIAIALGVYFGFFYNKKTPEPQTTAPDTTEQTTAPIKQTLNPLTGESGYDEGALTQRPVAVVVENEYSTAAVKPQWGISQADIVLEGESEFSTRMLMFWADYNKMPEQIGPTRSARPPFIRFSQLFNAVFIHAGLSHTAGGYVGADTVFENENVDHINLLSLSESGEYFGRDYSRTKVVEHTGYLNGTKVAKLLESKNIDTNLNMSKFTALSFNESEKKLSDTAANSVSFKWSSNCPKNAEFTYDEASGKYTTSDFDSKYGKSNVAWENLIFLLDTTEYVVKENYKGSGNSETYCNYDLSGGKGMICSNGTALEIQWGVTDGKLWMKDLSGNSVSLNPGKIYIGYGSSNHGGAYSLGTSSNNN